MPLEIKKGCSREHAAGKKKITYERNLLRGNVRRRIGA